MADGVTAPGRRLPVELVPRHRSKGKDPILVEYPVLLDFDVQGFIYKFA